MSLSSRYHLKSLSSRPRVQSPDLLLLDPDKLWRRTSPRWRPATMPDSAKFSRTFRDSELGPISSLEIYYCFIFMCMCVQVYVCVGACGRQRAASTLVPQVPSQIFRAASFFCLGLPREVRPQPRRSSCLCLHSDEITSACLFISLGLLIWILQEQTQIPSLKGKLY